MNSPAMGAEIDFANHSQGQVVSSIAALTLVAESDQTTLRLLGKSFSFIDLLHPVFGSLIVLTSSLEPNMVFSKLALDLGTYR